MPMKKAAVLCVARNSVYKDFSDIDVYDIDRDARTYDDSLPVVAHPPCRAWSAYCSHLAKPEAGERELGLWCAGKLKEVGGVMEHPAHSRLFSAADLPKPGTRQGHLTTVEVWQAWWGFPLRKKTWLCLSNIDLDNLRIPLRLHPVGSDRRLFQRMSRNQRSATTHEFARWLIDLAATATTEVEAHA